MRVIDPGHRYELDKLDVPEWRGDKKASLVFVKREGEKYPGNVGIHPGVTVQELLRCCVERLGYVNSQIQSHFTETAINDLVDAIWNLEARAAERHGRNAPTKTVALWGATCVKCGHVRCQGGCHGNSIT